MPKRPLVALTVHQPWAWCIAGGWKPVENREWWPGARNFINQPLAIHAGLQFDDAAAVHLLEHADAFGLPSAIPGPGTIASGAIVAVARIAGFVEVADDPTGGGELHVERVFGQLDHHEANQLADSPWARGPWLWVLRDVVAIEPVPCRGAQRLWTVPAPVVDQVRQAYRLARRAAVPAQGAA